MLPRFQTFTTVLLILAGCGGLRQSESGTPVMGTPFCAGLVEALLPKLLEESIGERSPLEPVLVDIGSFVQVTELFCGAPSDPRIVRERFGRPVRDHVMGPRGIGAGTHLRAQSIVLMDPYLEAIVTTTTNVRGRTVSEQYRLRFVRETRRLRFSGREGPLSVRSADDPDTLSRGECTVLARDLAPLILNTVLPSAPLDREVSLDVASLVIASGLFCGSAMEAADILGGIARPIRNATGESESGAQPFLRIQSIVQIGEEIEVVVELRSVRPSGYAAGQTDFSVSRLLFVQDEAGLRFVKVRDWMGS